MSVPGDGLDTPERNRRREARQNGTLAQVPPPPPPPEDDGPQEHWAVRHLREKGVPVTSQSLAIQRAGGEVVYPDIDALGNKVKPEVADESMIPAVRSAKIDAFLAHERDEDVLPDEGGSDDLDAAMASMAVRTRKTVSHPEYQQDVVTHAPKVGSVGLPSRAVDLVSLADSEGLTLTIATLPYLQEWERKMEAWLAAERAKDAAHQKKQDQAIASVMRTVGALLGKE